MSDLVGNPEDPFSYNEANLRSVSSNLPRVFYKRNTAQIGKRYQVNVKRTIGPLVYRTNAADVSVVINGTACNVTTVTDSELECETGSHSGSVRAQVEVQVAGNGIAQEVSIRKFC